jgi:hypothetical protein
MKSAQLYDDLAESALATTKANGIEIHNLTEAERAVFLELSNTVIAPHQAELAAKGLDAKGFYNEMIAFRDAGRK